MPEVGVWNFIFDSASSSSYQSGRRQLRLFKTKMFFTLRMMCTLMV